MKIRQFLPFAAITLFIATVAWGQAAAPRSHYDITREHMEYLDNGIVRVGADIDLGGAITYMADAKTRENVINNYDWGRQIQLSFYSGPVPYEPAGKKAHPNWTFIGWNPIQVGDVAGHRSRVLEFKNDGRELYTRCVPMHWPLDNAPGECTFETWITLDKNTVTLRGRLNNMRTSDTTQYPARGQELPAVYTNGSFYRLFTYSGDKPFTGDAVTTLPTVNGKGFPWHKWQATEHWAALLRADGWGLGVFNPDASIFNGGFAGKTGQGHSADAPTGYLAPWHQEIIDHNIQYDFKTVLILGTLGEIRDYAYAHAAQPAPPRYVFAKDRRHWHFTNATDAGWPIRDGLKIDLSKPNPQLHGPTDFWFAKDAPKLYIRAAFRCAPGKARVYWRRFGAGGRGEREINRSGPLHTLDFEIVPDGREHTYVIDLASSPEYAGTIARLGLVPLTAGKPGDSLLLKAVSFNPADAR